MEIGILTFHYCHNYGAMLQAYALKCVLEYRDNQVYFLDYRLPRLVRRYTLFPSYMYKERGVKGKVRLFLDTVLHLRSNIRRIGKFNKFVKDYFPELNTKMVKEVQLVIVGSDQLWNPAITGGFDSIYYGLMSNMGVPHIAYAVSCPAKYIREVDNRLFDNFNSISVRERTLLDALSEIGVKATLTIDPTLLLSSDEYIKLFADTNPIFPNYIFIYNLNGSSDLYNIAKKLSETADTKIIGNFKSRTHDVDYVYRDAGPLEFLSLLRNAEYSVVSSFHGVAFSILFRKKFIYYPFNNEKDERAFSILEQLGLERCIYSNPFDFSYIETIEWSVVEEKLFKLRCLSLVFLSKCIKDIDS